MYDYCRICIVVLVQYDDLQNSLSCSLSITSEYKAHSALKLNYEVKFSFKLAQSPVGSWVF